MNAPGADFNRLVEILLPGEKGFLVMLEAYLDETERGDFFGVACCAFTPEGARGFNREWGELLGDLRPFHTAPFASGRRPYRNRGISRTKRREIMAAAAAVIEKHLSFGVFVSCSLSEVMPLAPAWAHECRHAYAICCHFSLLCLRAKLEDNELGDRVAFFFESGHPAEIDAREFMSLVAKHPNLGKEYRRHSDAFIPKGDAPPLEAADFWAWQWGKYFASFLEGKAKKRPELEILMANPDKFWTVHLKGQDLKEIIARVDELVQE